MAAPRTLRPVRLEPLWLRVDRNRVKLAVFVALFVAGSAALLTSALVALPGWLLGWGADAIGLVPGHVWFARYPWAVAAALVLMLAVGAFMAAVQLANAEDWVRSRFGGRGLRQDEVPKLASVVADMSLAAGLPAPPDLMIVETDAVNAFAIGTTRRRPVLGVTRGFLDSLTGEEHRAVMATLTARICAGDILFGTALAALMGPLRAIRESREGVGAVAGGTAGCLSDGCSSGFGDLSGCVDAGDGCSGCADIGDSDLGAGCAGAFVIAVFLALVAAVTYAAVVTAAWIVTLWGRLLHRTSYEKADAEGMLLLKDAAPMLSALSKVVRSTTRVGDGDPSYDGIFYAPTSGTASIEPEERRRFARLQQVLGTEGQVATLPDRTPD